MWLAIKMWVLKKYDQVFNSNLTKDCELVVSAEPLEIELGIPAEPFDLDSFEF